MLGRLDTGQVFVKGGAVRFARGIVEQPALCLVLGIRLSAGCQTIHHLRYGESFSHRHVCNILMVLMVSSTRVAMRGPTVVRHAFKGRYAVAGKRRATAAYAEKLLINAKCRSRLSGSSKARDCQNLAGDGRLAGQPSSTRSATPTKSEWGTVGPVGRRVSDSRWRRRRMKRREERRGDGKMKL